MTPRGSVDRRPAAAPTGSLPRVPFTDLGTMTHEIRAEAETGFAEVVDSGRSIGGDAVERFEQAGAGYCGTGHAVGVAEGTDALQLALRAHDVGPGDEVVVPANTFAAPAGPRPPGGSPVTPPSAVRPAGSCAPVVLGCVVPGRPATSPLQVLDHGGLR